jgi:hypothetical protein
MQTGGTTVSTQTLSKESEKERQKNNRYNSKYKSSFKTLTSTSDSSGNTTSYSQQKGKNDKIKEKEYFLSKDSTGNAMGQVTKNDKMRIINGKPAENKMKRILKRNTTSSGELLKKGGIIKKAQGGTKVPASKYTSEKNTRDWAKKEREITGYKGPKITSKENDDSWAKKERAQTSMKNVKNALTLLKKGGVIKKMQAGGKIEEQYQKQLQKKVKSKQGEIDKIITPYPKTTLKKANSGIKVKKTTKPVAKKIVKSIKKKK